MRPSIRSLVAAVALIALALTAAPALAANGTVTGALKRLPKKAAKAQRESSVRAIRLDTGRLLATTAPRGARFNVKVSAGRWVTFAANVLDRPGSSYAGLSHALRVKRGKRNRVSVRMRRARKAASAKAAGRDVHGAAASGLVLGVKRIAVTGYPGGPTEIDGAVTTDLFEKPCADGSDKKLVEIRRRQDILDEIKLQNSRHADPKTRIKPHLIDPRQTVEGSGTVQDGVLTLELRVVDVKTGKTVARSSVMGQQADFFDVLDNATTQLVNDLCGIKADILFKGAGTYSRDEGPEDHSEHHIDADYTWEIAYKRVDLAGTPTTTGPAMAASSDVGGQWSDKGRFGEPGPGSYTCSGPVRGYNGDFAFTTVEQVDGQVRLTVMPFVSAQTDSDNISCTGLPGAPFSSFQVSGFEPPSVGIVQIDPERLLKGPIDLDVTPAAQVAPDCSDVIYHHENPCAQALSWSGTMTITRSAPAG